MFQVFVFVYSYYFSLYVLYVAVLYVDNRLIKNRTQNFNVNRLLFNQ